MMRKPDDCFGAFIFVMSSPGGEARLGGNTEAIIGLGMGREIASRFVGPDHTTHNPAKRRASERRATRLMARESADDGARWVDPA
jgi:hypothetical protein